MPPFQALPPAPFPEGSPHILPASLDSCFAFRVLLMLFLLLDCFSLFLLYYFFKLFLKSFFQ